MRIFCCLGRLRFNIDAYSSIEPLAEHPDMAPGEVMKGSKAMMEGNRWRLFCLQFSFIGWMLLSSLTFGLGNLALRPYQEAAYAAFYREVSLG